MEDKLKLSCGAHNPVMRVFALLSVYLWWWKSCCFVMIYKIVGGKLNKVMGLIPSTYDLIDVLLGKVLF